MLCCVKKSDLIKAAGTAAKLAGILGLSPQAVSAWPGDHVPVLQQYRIKELRPRWWRKGGPMHQSATTEPEATS